MHSALMWDLRRKLTRKGAWVLTTGVNACLVITSPVLLTPLEPGTNSRRWSLVCQGEGRQLPPCLSHSRLVRALLRLDSIHDKSHLKKTVLTNFPLILLVCQSNEWADCRRLKKQQQQQYFWGHCAQSFYKLKEIYELTKSKNSRSLQVRLQKICPGCLKTKSKTLEK